MIDIEMPKSVGAFGPILEQLALASVRTELSLQQIPAPKNLAQDAVAFSADMNANTKGEHTDLGTGRFVLLHQPAIQEQWGGQFRVIAFAKSPLETFIGADEMISEVAWSWLTDALRNRGVEVSHEAGTATRVISTGFGSLSGQSDHAELELRASWTPFQDFHHHLEAWQDLICMMSGYPLLPANATVLRPTI
ncbi:MAG: DUF3000 family protein [Micrococcales bacterium]